MDFKFEKKFLNRGFDAVIGCDEVGVGPLAGPVVAAAIVCNTESLLCAEKLQKLYNKNILPKSLSRKNSSWWLQVKDSKKLSAAVRQKISAAIKNTGWAWGIGKCEPSKIDLINIHQGTMSAMRSAVKKAVNDFVKKDFKNRSGTFGLSVEKNPEKIKNLKSLKNIKVKTYRFLIAADGRFIVRSLLLNDFKNTELQYKCKISYEQTAIVKGDNTVWTIAAGSILAKVYRDRIMTQMHSKFPEYSFDQNKGYGTEAHYRAIIKHGVSTLHRKTFIHDRTFIQGKKK